MYEMTRWLGALQQASGEWLDRARRILGVSASSLMPDIGLLDMDRRKPIHLHRSIHSLTHLHTRDHYY